MRESNILPGCHSFEEPPSKNVVLTDRQSKRTVMSFRAAAVAKQSISVFCLVHRFFFQVAHVGECFADGEPGRHRVDVGGHGGHVHAGGDIHVVVKVHMNTTA